MLGRDKFIVPILDTLSFLNASGIDIYVQIVVCPRVNDGYILTKTLEDLRNLPNVIKVAIVPVGLTKYRQSCLPLQAFTPSQAEEVVNLVSSLEAVEDNVFFALADEFYLKAGMELPAAAYYGNFEMLENGVGLLREFIDDFEAQIEDVSFIKDLDYEKKCILTSHSAYPELKKIVERFNCKYSMTIDLAIVFNDFWGESITVAGLLTGADIVKTILSMKEKYNIFIIPASVFCQDNQLTLDGLTISEICRQTGCNVKPVTPKGYDLFEELRGKKND